MRRKNVVVGAMAAAMVAFSPTILVLPARAAATDLYVSPAGSDQDAGTSSAPFKTIQASLDAASPGVVVHLAAGTYHEQPVTRTDGTATAPITIKGPETGKAVSGRYKSTLFGTSRIMSIDHSNYVLEGFTIDGQEALHGSKYPTGSTNVREFKDAAQSKVADGRLVYIGASEQSRDIHGVVIRDMYLNGAGGECLRMRSNAHDNVVVNSTIAWCGMYGKGDDVQRDKYHNGEAVYIGTSPKSTTQPMYKNDSSSNNLVENNVISTYGSECFNVKENAHDNVFRNNICRHNQEPLEWEGSAIELRGHDNQVVNNLLEGSLGFGVKLRSDSASYDKGGNVLRGNTFRDIAGAAVLNDQESAQGAACGNTFDSNRVLEGFPLKGLTSACAGEPAPIPKPTPTSKPSPTPTTKPSPTSKPTPTSKPSPGSSSVIRLEAESGLVKQPMVVVRDKTASGGAYITQQRESGTGSVSYSVTINATAEYRLAGRMIAPTSSSNSLYWAHDDAKKRKWIFEDDTENWTWETDVTMTLTRGTHRLLVTNREEGTRLDVLTLTRIS